MLVILCPAEIDFLPEAVLGENTRMKMHDTLGAMVVIFLRAREGAF